MTKIPLNGGGEVLVDDRDAPWLAEAEWYVNSCGYAFTWGKRANRDDPPVYLLMHRIIMLPRKYEVVHHRDRNPLNNQRANLQVMMDWDHREFHGRQRQGKVSKEIDPFWYAAIG